MNNRNLVTGIIAFVLIAISSTFIVDEREVVIKFRLGEIVTTYNEPGLYFMIPFLNNVKKNSKYFFNQLNKIKRTYPKIIKEIRGRGFLIGIQLHKNQSNFIEKLMDNKLLTIRAAENVVRILPPLNVKKNEIDQACAQFYDGHAFLLLQYG